MNRATDEDVRAEFEAAISKLHPSATEGSEMDKRKQKKIKRAAAVWRKPPAPCHRCGEPGAHFVPPSFGEPGFYVCKPKDTAP